MAVSDQEILDAAKDALHAILTGRVQEVREGSDSAQLLDLGADGLRGLIREYEQKTNDSGGNVLHPIREVDL